MSSTGLSSAHAALGVAAFTHMGAAPVAPAPAFTYSASPTGVTSNASKLLPVEVQDDSGNYHDIRDSSEYSCATSDTLLNGAYDFVFGVKSLSVQTTFSVRSASVLEDLPPFFLRAARHPAVDVVNQWFPSDPRWVNQLRPGQTFWLATHGKLLNVRRTRWCPGNSEICWMTSRVSLCRFFTREVWILCCFPDQLAKPAKE